MTQAAVPGALGAGEGYAFVAADPVATATGPTVRDWVSAHQAGRPQHDLPWQRQLRAMIAAVDAVAVSAAVGLGLLIRFGWDPPALSGLSARFSTGYIVAAGVIAVSWWVSLSVAPTRDAHVLGSGLEEYKRVLLVSVRVFSAVAIAAYLVKVDLARLFVAIAFPLGVLFLLGGRWALRQWLRRARRRGHFLHRVLVVGGGEPAGDLADWLARFPQAGFDVVGVHTPSRFTAPGSSTPVADEPAAPCPPSTTDPLIGAPDSVAAAVLATAADVVAVVPSADLGPQGLRRLAWSLEGSGVDLIVSPALTDVAGPRVQVRPVAGLPLLHVAAPRYEGLSWLVKSVFDRVAAGLALVVLSPVLAVVALLVAASGPGPILFRHERVGLGGRPFRVYKFRTMVDGADAMADGLAARNAALGLPYKTAADPRVTPVGRWLRRTSLDELPQLINVLAGQMSLVGPRPLVPAEIEQYDPARRRLLVKPGITGLWQVSGRSDTSWEDRVRLDLYYVENWSLSGDLVILARTVAAVLRGEGAY